MMVENNISSLVVTNGTSLNILTKSDLVKLYAEQYKNISLVSEFMTEDVFTVSPSHSIHTVIL